MNAIWGIIDIVWSLLKVALLMAICLVIFLCVCWLWLISWVVWKHYLWPKYWKKVASPLPLNCSLAKN